MSWLSNKAKTKEISAFCCLALLIVSSTFLYLRYVRHLVATNPTPLATQEVIRHINETFNFGARTDVPTFTSWEAPIVWEGMFDPNYYDQMHIQARSSVALTVFAVGRYLDAYLQKFLITAEQHFMLGLPVTYYVFTDVPQKVPDISFAQGRSMRVIQVERYSRWQDISMMRMKMLSDAIQSEIRYNCNYVFCFDVDQEFKGRFGSEALGDSVAMVHSNFYRLPKHLFTYDKNPQSVAFMETGDYYYHAAIFGGSWKSVKDIVDACYVGIMEDKLNNVEALWHDESHLNKYYWLHKPTKLLSPEYCWDPNMPDKIDIRIVRVEWAPKHYDTLRTR